MNDNYFELESGHGKKPNQRLKPWLVLQYLLKNTDSEHTASATTIAEYLKEFCGVMPNAAQSIKI